MLYFFLAEIFLTDRADSSTIASFGFTPFHYSTIPLFHYSTIPLFHYSTTPLFHISTIPLFHYSTTYSIIPLFHSSILSLFHSFTLPLFQCFTLSLFHISTVPFFHYSTVRLFHYYFAVPQFTLLHYHKYNTITLFLFAFLGSTRHSSSGCTFHFTTKYDLG